MEGKLDLGGLTKRVDILTGVVVVHLRIGLMWL